MSVVTNPDVEQVAVMDRKSGGKTRTVMQVNSGLTGSRKKSYKVTVINRAGGVVEEDEGPVRKKRKQTKRLKPMEKAARKTAQRGIRFMENYLHLHERSNMKKKDGWLKSYGKNIRKAFKHSADD